MEENLKQTETRIIKIAIFGPIDRKTTLTKQINRRIPPGGHEAIPVIIYIKLWKKGKETCSLQDIYNYGRIINKIRK
jgi:hypothetical protein